MTIAVMIIYLLMLSMIFLYSIMQFILALNYLRLNKRVPAINTETVDRSKLPTVTIQIPIYNELYVVERIIRSVAAIDYPKDKLEIQVLDDSNDETFEIAARVVDELQQTGLDIVHIQRPKREGFKAGALEYGMKICKGEFIAVFDADFLPKTTFLLETMPHFNDPRIGVVQARWTHLNWKDSLLTRIQAFALDLHFSIEQQGRTAAGVFINFNGTAGVWRKECIEDAGGWKWNTLTEDFELSYRAQLKGWKFRYLENVTAPAELPIEMNALKAQQFRWNKGGAETARLMGGRLLRAKGVGFKKKLFGMFHLLASTNYLFIFIMALSSVPFLILKQDHPVDDVMQYAMIFIIGTIGLTFAFIVSRRTEDGHVVRKFFNFLWLFPLFLIFSMGLSLYNAISVIQGYIGFRTDFIRTPKFNKGRLKELLKTNRYIKSNFNLISWLEGLMVVYFGWAIYLSIDYKDYDLLPIHGSAFIGFLLIFLYSVVHTIRTRTA